MRKWSVFIFIVTLSLVLLLSGNVKILASSELGDCLRLTRQLSFSGSICQGKDFKSLEANLNQSKHNQTEALHQLGIVLRELRYLRGSQLVLQQALEYAPNDESIALSLANLQHQAYRQAIFEYHSSDIKTFHYASIRDALVHAKSALEIYQSLYKNLSSEKQIIAALDWLSTWSALNPSLLDQSDLKDLTDLQQNNISTARSLIDGLQTRFPSLDAEKQAEARISLARSLLRLNDPAYSVLSLQNAESVISLSPDLKLLSKAYGIKGQLLKPNEPSKAIAEYSKALSAAQSVRANELIYEWQWELAKLYKQVGQQDKALKLYETALNNINQIRNGILQLSLEIQYDFRDKIEPFYGEYIDLLLESQNPDLEKIVSINDQLQLSELENYLQCNTLNLTRLIDLPEQNLPDANIYIIKLPSRYLVIVRKKDGTSGHRILDSETIDKNLKQVKQVLEGDHSNNLEESSYQRNFKNLYQELFKPIEGFLPKEGTLLITTDSTLQSIPWAILFDGQQYLIERYSIAHSFGTELIGKENRNTSNSKVLIAGLSEQTNERNFPALPNVLKEVEAINLVDKAKTKTLLNKEFTISKLIQAGEDYPVIHLATHGQVSSDPSESFILGWDERITLNRLQDVVHHNSRLKLLVLSACETAKGDKRASLGLAGSAYQAGAQSTVATLWLVEDESQSELMGEFYKALKEGKSKADALRKAQLSLLNSPNQEYRNPFFWGGTILLGSWE